MEMLFKRMEANNVAFVILNTSNRWLGIALVRFTACDKMRLGDGKKAEKFAFVNFYLFPLTILMCAVLILGAGYRY
jgi:hypothetical protein